ncbi:hypothetical protein [Comamonas sp. 4034]|uniref:hypothetical protein n=1 Tax=Comamonas sp. 4034 TaxID=3156455 RepID=UPI003D1C0B16
MAKQISFFLSLYRMRRHSASPIEAARWAFDPCRQNHETNTSAAHLQVLIRKHQKLGPDPFTQEEVEHLLTKFGSDRGRDFYEFSFFSGMRPSEMLALKWTNVDLRAGSELVDATLTRGKMKGTKISAAREIELTSRTLRVLEHQRKLTQLAGGVVFVGD